MANLFNSGGGLQNLGLLLGALSNRPGQFENMFNMRLAMDERDERKREATAKESNALKFLKSSGNLDADIGGKLQMTGVESGNPQLQRVGANMQQAPALSDQFFNSETVGANAPQTDTNMFNLAKAGGYGNMLNLKMEQQIKGEEPYNLGPNEKRFKNGKVVAENIIPTKPDIPADAALVKYYQSLPDGPEKQQLGAIIQQKVQGPAKSMWRPPTQEEMARYNLNPNGTYQIDQNGNVQVITQPKQDSPTEGQEKFAFNADRVGGALKSVKDVLGKNPGAATNFWLDTTNNIPGLDAAGRKMVNDDAQIVRNNLGDAIDAIITLGTGAAYTEEQLKAQRNKYLPRPGESPNVIKSKFDALVSVYDNAKKRARAAGRDLPDVSEFAGIYGTRAPGQAAGATGTWGVGETRKVGGATVKKLGG